MAPTVTKVGAKLSLVQTFFRKGLPQTGHFAKLMEIHPVAQTPSSSLFGGTCFPCALLGTE